MPLRQTHNARRYNTRITLTMTQSVVDDYGHASMGEPVDVMDVYAYVEQMSATKTMMTFQQADAVGLDIEFRKPAKPFNGIRYNGKDVFFALPKELERGRILQISGWYQQDR